MIFETHAHYDDEKFDEDRAELLSSMQENGIGRIINVSANLESLENTRKLMEAYPFIYGAFGLHPDEVGDLNEDVMARMRELCRMEKAVAVGEIGLDYYWDKENHEKQEYWFRRQIALAREEKLPMIIHSREAAADTLRVMKEEKSEEIGGVIHCFSYSMAPMERILLETDSPYLAPVPYRGKRNSSLYLPYVVQEIAELKGISEEEVIETTEKNAVRLFRAEE